MPYRLSVFAFCLLVTALSISAQTQVKITADDPAPHDFYGRSVSVDGDTVVIGAIGNDDAGTNSGSAYVYSRNEGGVNGWGKVAKLTAPDAAAGDSFGVSVSVDGDTAVIGAYRDVDGGAASGSAYVFLRDQGGSDNWGYVAKLTADDGSDDDFFGFSVSVDDDTAVIGAGADNDGGSESGSAYVYSRNQGGAENWGQVIKLTASDAEAFDRFGHSVSVDGDTVVIGAYWDDDGGNNSGSAYLYSRHEGGDDNWGLVAKLTADDAVVREEFGTSVSVDGDTAVIGAAFGYGGEASSGSAYVYSRNHGGADNWGQVAKLIANDASTQDQFGTSVSVDGNTAVIGAWLDSDDGLESGSAYLYSRNRGGPDRWGQFAKLTAGDASQHDHFGVSVAADGDTAVIGAASDGDGGEQSGSAYVIYGLDVLFKSGFGSQDCKSAGHPHYGNFRL
ncbi:MAG: hypothetical protein DHS20C11_24300 [Lysobacteraceae bacterium]|nr:MAG: hypothetical protein DHS20C11_24300 [Xanthomonadaceae bacterium]